MPEQVAQRVPVTIEEEMKRSYMDYAMSVIIGRALPDVRDGLKPVHRRVLYAMHELGNTWNRPYKKSARIVGDVIGKYHPHGDVPVYDTMVRMVQEFSMRYPLIDGQGNFGSVDGDPPAAMRYTEVRMARLAADLLADIEKDTVEFGPNYDGSLQEPLILPCRFPNFLVNGASGIAVGMATNVPPHNLGEVVDALTLLIERPEATLDEIMERVPGPDFPTAGFICGREGIRQAYETGRGIIQVRGRARIEKVARGDRENIVITEIPYQVNKAKLVERIAELIRDRKIEGVSDLRDESTERDGMRIVLELKKDEIAGVILNQLYKHTQLQESFGIIMLALADGRPKVLTLKETLQRFIDHRKEVVTRRCHFDLKKAEARAHILEGLKIALEHLDEVIALIRRSREPADAKQGLMRRFRLSEEQAQAILDMRLQRLTSLERGKVVQEYEEVQGEIAELRAILADERRVLTLIVQELGEIKEAYGDDRRTEIIEEAATEFRPEDLIVEEEMVVTISHAGYIKRNPISLYRAQRRGGRGVQGAGTREEDFVEHLFIAFTHSYILFFTDAGRVYWLKVHELPQAGRAARGKAIVNLLNLGQDEKVAAILPIRSFDDARYVMMATKNGVVKKTELTAFSNPRSGGIIALTIEEGDRVIAVGLTDGEQDVFLGTREGVAVRFKEDQVRPMGRAAVGVKGITLEEGDEVVGMEIVRNGTTILTVGANGFGKRSRADDYRSQNRGGKGLINMNVTERTGPVVGIKQVTDADQMMLITDRGRIIRLKVSEIRVQGRNTQGVKLIEIENGERVSAVARLAEAEEESREDNGGEDGGT
ncbi:MAG: DNA gyrase subunit A [Deltaproteobacteria bacterium]|nr:DNA gyrase subunit A [Deltaproteobacteria bacterium]